jgi:hypothetical protein
MITWHAYVAWFTPQYDALMPELMELGSTEYNNGPILSPKDRKFPRSAPFGVDWAMFFPSDNKYFRVKECFNRVGWPNAGLGVREHFSYHYGTPHLLLDFDGFPVTQDPETPFADLRIDRDATLDPHIHLNSGEHIYQDRVQGYSIEKADLFEFLKAVSEHRKTGTPIHELLNIKLLP